jgi:hypothetical protein
LTVSIQKLIQDFETLATGLEAVADNPSSRDTWEQAHAQVDDLIHDLGDLVWGSAECKAAVRAAVTTAATAGGGMQAAAPADLRAAARQCREFADQHKMHADPAAPGAAGKINWQNAIKAILAAILAIFAGA